MGGRGAVALMAATAVLAGCGGDEQRPAAKATPERTATSTPTPTPTPQPAPRRARSLQDCVDIWNASVEAGTGTQVTHTDYVADNVGEGRTQVRVALRRGVCVVVLPIGAGRVSVLTKRRGTEIYSLPRRESVPAGVRVVYNARGREDGSIRLR